MGLGAIVFFLVALGAAVFRGSSEGRTGALRQWLRAFLVSIGLWVFLAPIGFVTSREADEFDLPLLLHSFVVDAGWAAAGAILGVAISRRRSAAK